MIDNRLLIYNVYTVVMISSVNFSEKVAITCGCLNKSLPHFLYKATYILRHYSRSINRSEFHCKNKTKTFDVKNHIHIKYQSTNKSINCVS